MEITRFKLSKMIFYIYADYLVKYNQPLFEEQPRAWYNGSLFSEVVKALKRNCRQKKMYDITPLKTVNPLTPEQIAIIHYVVNKYGPLEPHELTEKMDQEEPYLKTFDIYKHKARPIIPHHLIRRYYKKHPI